MNDLLTHGELLARRTAEHARLPFLIIDEEQLSFADFGARTSDLARAMLARGIGKGSHVGILMPNCPEFLLAYWAAQAIGAVAVPINARYKSSELGYVLGFSDIEILFTTDRIDQHVNFADLLFESLPDLANCSDSNELALASAPRLKRIVMFGNSQRSPLLAADEFRASAQSYATNESDLLGPGTPDDICLMLFTSGTTAHPKACQLTHRNLAQTWLGSYPVEVSLATGEKIWCPLPCFHIGGVGLALTAMDRGACFVSSVHHEPGHALRYLKQHKPEHLYPGFFTLVLPMLREPGYEPSDLSFVRSLVMVAPHETHLQMRDLLPTGIATHQTFGITEGAGTVGFTQATMTEQQRIRCNGRALTLGEIRIADPESNALVEAGIEGEIQFRGPQAFVGYYKDENATCAAHSSDGWVKTGDWGRLDDDGILHYRGRIKDMLKVGGENVAAAEIEAFLGRHPAVALAQVVGKPDDKYGEVVVAFVQLLAGASATRDELIAFCRGKLASYKAPREVIFVDSWPMSATKIQKFKLREMLTNTSC
jgi:acyl-CoA synthetase (AMP-forming)/AMP-acid ligase II